MKNVIRVAAVILAGGFLLALAPEDEPINDQVADLRVQLANLTIRVNHLEHASGASTLSGASTESLTVSPPSGAMTMILSSVSDVAHNANDAQDIARLKNESTSLMNTSNQYAVQMANDAGQTVYAGRSSEGEAGWGQASGSTVVSTNVGAVQRQVVGDRELQNRYANLAYVKRQQLKGLQDAASRPKQILHGHDADGKVIFILHTMTDLTQSLNSIQIGDTVTWTGNRLSADAGSETWNIQSISKAE